MGFLSGCVTLSDDPEASQSWRAAGPSPAAGSRMPGGAMRSVATTTPRPSTISQVPATAAGGSSSFSDPEPSLPESDTSLQPSGPALPEATATTPKPIQAEGALARARTILLEAARDAAPALRAHAVEAAEFDSTLANRVLPIAAFEMPTVGCGSLQLSWSLIEAMSRTACAGATPSRPSPVGPCRRCRSVGPSESEGRPGPLWPRPHFRRPQSTEPMPPCSLEHFGTQQDVRLLREASSSPFAPGTPEAQRRIVSSASRWRPPSWAILMRWSRFERGSLPPKSRENWLCWRARPWERSEIRRTPGS